MKCRIEATCSNRRCPLENFTTLRKSMTYRANRDDQERIITRVPCPSCGSLAQIQGFTQPEQAVA